MDNTNTTPPVEDMLDPEIGPNIPAAEGETDGLLVEATTSELQQMLVYLDQSAVDFPEPEKQQHIADLRTEIATVQAELAPLVESHGTELVTVLDDAKQPLDQLIPVTVDGYSEFNQRYTALEEKFSTYVQEHVQLVLDRGI